VESEKNNTAAADPGVKENTPGKTDEKQTATIAPAVGAVAAPGVQPPGEKTTPEVKDGASPAPKDKAPEVKTPEPDKKEPGIPPPGVKPAPEVKDGTPPAPAKADEGKARIIELCEVYGKATYTLLQEKVPGAYDYLGDHHAEWLCERMTTVWETGERLEFVKYAQKKVEEATAYISVNPPKRQISYGYIAEIAGLTRDNLRSNSRIHACVEGFVESREDWHCRRITEAYHSKPIEDRPYTAIEICRAASMEKKTYEKYRELFEEVVRELNENTIKI